MRHRWLNQSTQSRVYVVGHMVSLRSVVLSFIALLLSARCSGPAPDSRQSAETGWKAALDSLKGADLPANLASIESVLEQLPPTVAGRTREAPRPRDGGREVTYGNTSPTGCGTVGISATLASAWLVPGTPREIVDAWRTGTDWQLVASGGDNGILWVRVHTTCAGGQGGPPDNIELVLWTTDTDSDGGVFGASASDEPTLDALVVAFLDAMRRP